MATERTGLTIVVEFTIHEGKEDEFLEVVRAHLPRNAQDPGLEAFSVHRDLEHPNRFLFFEEWASRAAFDASLLAPWRDTYFPAITPLGERSMRTLEPTDLRFPA